MGKARLEALRLLGGGAMTFGALKASVARWAVKHQLWSEDDALRQAGDLLHDLSVADGCICPDEIPQSESAAAAFSASMDEQRFVLTEHGRAELEAMFESGEC